MQIDNKAAIFIIVAVLAVFLWIANGRMSSNERVDTGALPGAPEQSGLIIPG